jgi:dihydroceramidase
MVFLGLFGIYLSYKSRADYRIYSGFIGLFLVGLGSIAFHGSLRYDAQLMDELPMLWADGAFVYGLSPKSWRETQFGRSIMVTILTTWVMTVSGLYVWTRNVLLFELSFGLVATIIITRAAHWAYTHQDSKHRDARNVIKMATVLLVTAFSLWMIDNTVCETLRTTRSKIGPFLAPLLQLHAWWHVLSGSATYLIGIFIAIYEGHERDPLPVLLFGQQSQQQQSQQLDSQCLTSKIQQDENDIEYGTNSSNLRLSRNMIGMPIFIRQEKMN